MSENPSIRLYRRVTNSVPLLVSVILHAILIAVVGYFVVTETIIGKKKQFDAELPPENTSNKQLDHRIQVARKSSGSSPSPVSAQRIFSTAENALKMPTMTELPKSGASALGSSGFGQGMGVTGGGSGYNTGLGNGNGLGRGFMSMSFLGVTNANASKVVFVLDVSPQMMDLRKGGVKAFDIIRTEAMKLINRLPPSGEFGVVIYSGAVKYGQIARFEETLLPATIGNKERFFTWMKQVNADTRPEKMGVNSVVDVKRWRPRDLPDAGLDSELSPPDWGDALRCAFELQPDTIFQITCSGHTGFKTKSEAQIAKETIAFNQKKAQLKEKGIDFDTVVALERAAMVKAGKQLEEIMARARAKGQPLPPAALWRALQPDYLAMLKSRGETITVDKTGWTDEKGVSLVIGLGVRDVDDASLNDLLMYFSKLRRALLKNPLSIYEFLFVGAAEMGKIGAKTGADQWAGMATKASMDNLSKLCRSNSGKLSVITSKSLEEFENKESEKK